MSKQQWNLRLSKARLSTIISHTRRTELDKVQERFAATTDAPSEIDYFAMLPVGCWSMNNAGGIYTINLHDNILHSIGCQYLRGFSGRSASEAARKAAEWVQRIGGEE